MSDAPRRRRRGGEPVFPGFRDLDANRRALVEQLVRQRQALGLSQTEVAARMGTSQSAVARLEAGNADVRVTTLERYAGALGRRLDWRLGPPPVVPMTGGDDA